MALSHKFDKDYYNQVLFEGNSCVKKIILNRPRKLNILNYHMISQMTQKLKLYESDQNVKLVILKGKGKAFCVGGDVVSAYTCIMAGHWVVGAKGYEKQLMLDHIIATYKKPLIAMVDGIVMGGGAGLSMNATFRVVTEKTVFAMPEAEIGLFTDVGASYFLSRLPGHFGEYLALTGARINGREIVECGLATHFILSKNLLLLENALEMVTFGDKAAISEIISKFSEEIAVEEDSFFNRRLDIFNKCFSRKTVEEILSSLEQENGQEEWILKAINSMTSSWPSSLKISCRSIREGRVQALEQCLICDYTIFCNIVRRTVSNDFFEGNVTGKRQET
ncbi:3-hydroxyisobutyryl-CoA hydrolase 1-like isoform X2 [Tripterygium wilfordii]|uniref:3-hydroxyisobutyryl-CoA hydrolase 1-like isoform X2 n=1 Tax=Tripterygium wilfordii TaxID=458696 RepID=UPI0018F7E7D7|nr:3-hydroxyisobutyryl-CoA hydrolase 1-like isoform X2 [Tripterygium wilfordii]